MILTTIYNWIKKLMKIKMKSGSVTIKKTKYVGTNISIINGVVQVDGVVQQQSLIGDIDVVINGEVSWIESGSGSVVVHGNCTNYIQSGSGDIKCGDVSGNIQTGSGSIKCGSVGGSVKSGSGNITIN